MNFSVCITVYGTLDTTLAGRGRRNLLFRMRTCTLEPPGIAVCNCLFTLSGFRKWLEGTPPCIISSWLGGSLES